MRRENRMPPTFVSCRQTGQPPDEKGRWEEGQATGRKAHSRVGVTGAGDDLGQAEPQVFPFAWPSRL